MFDKSQLTNLGLKVSKEVYYNLPAAQLVEMAVKKGQGRLAASGALTVLTGERTGRSPNDRYIVEEKTTRDDIWWGEINRPIGADKFDYLFEKVRSYLGDKDIFVYDAFSGADERYRLPVRVISRKAWHALFAQTLFRRPTRGDLETFEPGFTVIDTMSLRLSPKKDGFRSPVAIIINFEKRMILVTGSGYGGEIKKGIFYVMNYFLPKRGILSMHCSANVGSSGDTALFFGLSGTGKTTLSADPNRRLIGDDQHGWSDDGIFNFEGGCYAKCIRLSAEEEPQIYNAIKFGSIVENVVVDQETRKIDYDDDSITENTRATYPVEYIPNCLIEGKGSHPKNVFFLACDAFGVLPPIAKLTPEMAMYHFISGYTAKLAGTEVGVIEPAATFSACFGAPFLPLNPNVYAEHLGEKLKKHRANCWLVNTGWSGGAYGTGSRIKISITRALLNAALSGALDNVDYRPHSVFKVLMPDRCPDVPQDVLDPKIIWKDKKAYRETALKLAGLFADNFRQFENGVSKEVISAGPGNL